MEAQQIEWVFELIDAVMHEEIRIHRDGKSTSDWLAQAANISSTYWGRKHIREDDPIYRDLGGES